MSRGGVTQTTQYGQPVHLMRRSLLQFAHVRFFTLAITLALGSGCSLIFDGDGFRVADAGPTPDAPLPDAPIADAAPPTDVDPSMLMITAVEPDNVFEGEGSAAGARAIPILVTGSMIAADAVITIELASDGDAGVDADAGAAPAIVVGDTVVSSDGTMAATTVAVPVMDQLDDGQTLELELVVSQAGVRATRPFVINGLDELDVAGGNFDTDAVRPARFSTIDFGAAVHFQGTKPARLHATSAITIAAAIDANGRNGSTGGAAGAGGCPGGGSQAPGGCGTGGGGGGNNDTLLGNGPGGGGGGYGGVGGPGTTVNAAVPGMAGTATGSETLVPLDTGAGQPGNRGNGGGGGGKSGLGAAGGVGGGGGGAIELRTDGTITITGAGAVRADGGDGEAGGGNGGGGGGSGGAILLHAGTSIVNDTGAPVVSADGGDPGTRAGVGGGGRIRIDGPALPGTLVSSPAPLRGPAWRADMPTIVRAATADAVLTGQPGRAFAVWVDDTDRGTETIGGGGTRSVSIPLVAGLNQVCAFVGTTADFLVEASTCRAIIYLP